MIPPHIIGAINAADYVVGADECGYGSWAGPLVVCAAAVSRIWPLAHLVKDSKAFTGDKAQARREAVAKQILPTITFAIVSVSSKEIDAQGVGKMLPLAHGRAIDAAIAKHSKDGVVGTYAVIVDGTLKVFYGGDKVALSLPKGDALIPAISAASIVGKVARDRVMAKFAEQYPGYGFEDHKGYGGDANHPHMKALTKLGMCEIHRRSYAPMKDMVQEPAFDFSTLGVEGGDE